MSVKLSPEFIEFIHDVMVAAFFTDVPECEMISPEEYRDAGLIASSAGRPFLTAFGEELYPTLIEKGAALFHSLVCNHCFFNGNKRTAVIALDAFLTVNRCLLTISHQEVYNLATETAVANQNEVPLETVKASLVEKIGDAAIEISVLDNPTVREGLGEERIAKLLADASNYAAFAVQTMERLRNGEILRI